MKYAVLSQFLLICSIMLGGMAFAMASKVTTKTVTLRGPVVIGDKPVPWNDEYTSGVHFNIAQQALCDTLRQSSEVLKDAWDKCEITHIAESNGHLSATVTVTLNQETSINTDSLLNDVRAAHSINADNTSFGDDVVYEK